MLRTMLIERALEHPLWGEKMPTAWVPLELKLAQEVENGKNILSRTQLEFFNTQNRSFVLTERQLESFLKIQHSLGKLVYFDDIHLKNFIIINPMYLIEVLRSIITDKQFWPKESKLTEAFQRLRQEGIIDRSTIYSIWEQDKFRHIIPYKDFMIDILVHLDVLVAPKADFYFTELPLNDIRYFLVPCMITEPDKTDFMANHYSPSTSIVLAYEFIDDVIPPALSYRFLGSLLTMWDLKVYNGIRMLFSDLAVVHVGRYHDVAVQVIEKRVVVSLIHSESKSKIVSTLVSSVQECLTAAIHRISIFYSSLSGEEQQSNQQSNTPFEIQFGVICNSSICFFNHTKMPSIGRPIWRCPTHKVNHDISSLRHWYAVKVKYIILFQTNLVSI